MYGDKLVFALLLANTSNMLICSRDFLGYLQPNSFGAKSIDVESAFAGGTCIEGAFIKVLMSKVLVLRVLIS